VNQLLVAFPIQESDDQTTIDVARQFGYSLNAPVTLFVNQPSSRLRALLEANEIQWTDLGLGSRTNRYISENTAVAAWNPWGYKSGPNRDFFAIMDWCQNQGTEWVLLAEADLLPIGSFLEARVKQLLLRADKTWVVGAEPSTESKRLLDPRLHDHINGAAFYRVGSQEFGAFRRLVWAPSLISLIKYFPFFAYDCVTATEVWDLLSEHLRDSWDAHRQYIYRTELMLNLSNLLVSKSTLNDFIGAPSTPLFIHAKLQP